MKCSLKVLIGLAVSIVIAIVITCAIVYTRPSNDDDDFEDDGCTLTGNSVENFTLIQQNCTEITIRDLTVPAGETLSLTHLIPGSVVRIRGVIRFEYAEWTGYLILVNGTNITIIGEPGHVLDGEGSRWWDGLGGNGGVPKPRFFRVQNLYDSVVTGLNIRNTPRHCFSIINCRDVVFSDITMDNLDGDDNGGHNTDAFNLGRSNGITIQNSRIVNQDDCLAVNSGSNYYFYNNYCSGGHGISIGSVGNRSSNVVENVHIKNCTIVNSENGIRIKTIYNATGEVSDITYEDIMMGNITDFGILVRGDYRNIGPTGTPTDGFVIRNFTLTNIQGWVQENAVNTFVLLADGVASGWRWTNVNVIGGIYATNCTGIPENSGAAC